MSGSNDEFRNWPDRVTVATQPVQLDLFDAEESRRVVRHPGYEVSSAGRVRSVDRVIQRSNGRGPASTRLLGRLSKRHRNRNDHLQVPLSGHLEYVHRRGLSAFVGPYPPDMECCHWDDNKANNNVWNLRWASRSASIKDCVSDSSHSMARRTHCARGHAHSPENTRVRKSGGRRCVTCVGEDCRRRYARNIERLKEEARRRCARRRAPFKEAV